MIFRIYDRYKKYHLIVVKFIKQKKRNLLYLLLARVNIHTSPLHLRSRHSRERLTRILVWYLDWTNPIEQKISTNDQMSLGRFFPPFHQSAFKSPAHFTNFRSMLVTKGWNRRTWPSSWRGTCYNENSIHGSMRVYARFTRTEHHVTESQCLR